MSFVAIGAFPIAFYALTRWVVCITAGWSAFSITRRHKARPFPQRAVLAFVPVLAGIAIVFNPVAPIPFHRDVWHTLDAGTGVWLLATALAVSMLGRPEPDHNAPKTPG